jgi:hypothetical protein
MLCGNDLKKTPFFPAGRHICLQIDAEPQPCVPSPWLVTGLANPMEWIEFFMIEDTSQFAEGLG